MKRTITTLKRPEEHRQRRVEAPARRRALQPALHATISADGNRIEGRWEYDEGGGWKVDFDMVYAGVR
jgi:hypothetical protein